MLSLNHIWLIPLLLAFGAAAIFLSGQRIRKTTVSAVCKSAVAIIPLGAIRAGEAASWFDAKIIDGAVNDVGWVMRAVATLSTWCDKWMIDSLGVNGPAILARMLSYPACLFEWGLVQWYALIMVAGLLGFGVYYVWL